MIGKVVNKVMVKIFGEPIGEVDVADFYPLEIAPYDSKNHFLAEEALINIGGAWKGVEYKNKTLAHFGYSDENDEAKAEAYNRVIRLLNNLPPIGKKHFLDRQIKSIPAITTRSES